MIEKYNSKLVFDYIHGNDIDCDIDKLEDNSKFMIDVIKFSNDKRMYQFCSDNVKKDFDFVSFVITKFSDDIFFVKKVANYYLDNVKNENCEQVEDDIAEINIIVSNIISKVNRYNLNKYNLRSEMFYTTRICLINEVADNEKIKHSGLYFNLIEGLYETRPVILTFFIKKLLNELFYSNEKLNFDELIHNDVNAPSKIENSGMNNYLIDFINKYDDRLSWYVSCNIELLKPYKKELKRVIDNWDNYERIINEEKVEIFNQKLDEYEASSNTFHNFCIYQLVEHMINKYNLQNEFNDNKGYVEFKKIYNDAKLLKDNEENLFNKENMNLADLQFYNYADKLTKELFGKTYIDKDNYKEQDKSKKAAKIINFKANK